MMHFLRSLFLLYTFLLLSACNENNLKEKQQRMLEIREMSDLATVQYIVTKIIKAKDDSWFKVGTRKILMSCKASLTAGIDLSKISEKNIDINHKTIDLTLPHATLLSLDIKPEDIVTEYEDVSLLRSAFTSAERDALATQGETSIRNSVDSLGILQTAEVNANFILTAFLQKMGYEKINIHYGDINKSRP